MNSKTEYSRCRLPRLTIDREEWKTAKQQERKGLDDEEKSSFDEELSEEEMKWLTDEEGVMAAWNEENARKESKRKSNDGVRDDRSAKRKKLDVLVDWGKNGEKEEEHSDIRSWLLGDEEDTVTEMVDKDEPLLELAKQEIRLRQMELDKSKRKT